MTLLPADLQEEAGVADEGDAEFAVRNQPRFVRLAAQWSHSRVAHQASKLRRAFAQGRIAKRCFNHPAREPVTD